MTYLFDASAIVNLVKKAQVRAFLEGVTLDLAVYESLNAIWKECHLLRRIDRRLADKWVGLVAKVFMAMKTLSIRDMEGSVLDLACKEGLTIYDASYLYVAMEKGYTLVSDDEKLRKVASKYLKVLSSSDLV